MKEKKETGFTLIEIVVVMAIIAVLAVLVVGAISIARNMTKETTHRANARSIQTGMEAYYSRNRQFPPATEGGNGLFGSESISFEMVAANDPEYLNVSLSPASECDGPDEWGDGGGQVWITTDRQHYTITPYDSGCSDEMIKDRLMQ
ncbi:MAG: type II secretion system protein [bacterium]|nr:type II secretion system protein [bacterium]